MLVNRNKDKQSKKKLLKKEPEISEETIQSLQSWVRKIEQSTTSISARLSAVEKRISGKKLDATNSSIPGNLLEGPIERIFHTIKDEKKKQHVENLAGLLDTEFSVMQEELITQQETMETLAKELDNINASLQSMQSTLKHLTATTSQLSTDLAGRVEKMERREPPVVHIGSMEIPIEITGVIGGLIAFIFAGLVFFDQKDIIVSPIFLILIGILLIGSALFKSLNIRSSSLKFWNRWKTEDIQPVEEQE